MHERERIHTHVNKAYTKAVTSKMPAAAGQHDGGCCCSPHPNPPGKGVAAQWAGYDVRDTASLPDTAVANSFGCGNPLAFSEVQPGETVLDLGSGAGLDLLLAARRVGREGKVIGVDMTDAMLLEARENAARAGFSDVIDVRKGIIEELPVEDASVDWVISNCVINLSPEKDKVFAEIYRVLKPGGRMRVSDLMVEDLPAWMRSDERLYNTCLGGAISRSDYLAGLERAGMVDVQIPDELVYDRSQVRALVSSEVEIDGESGCGCGGQKLVDEDEIERAADMLTGKVVSAIVTAARPA